MKAAQIVGSQPPAFGETGVESPFFGLEDKGLNPPRVKAGVAGDRPLFDRQDPNDSAHGF